MSDEDKNDAPTPVCFVCGKELETLFSDSPQAHGATMFDTYGHYGSTVFDPMDGETSLTISVCDEHLLEHSDRVVQRVMKKRAVYTYDVWEPRHT